MSEILVSRELLEALAPATPFNQDEQGGCVWCGGSPVIVQKNGKPDRFGRRETYGYATANPADHEDNCPWVEARRVLGGDHATTEHPLRNIERPCAYCGAVIDGGPGGYFAIETGMERCELSPTAFHEPRSHRRPSGRDACCDNENRSMNGGCLSCGDPCI